MDYKILLEIKGVYNETYTEENISLGTAIKETLDKSYDVGSLEILLTDIEDEYQPYTPVILTIYNTIDDQLSEIQSYNMIIESDDVRDEYIGNRIKYTHKITLIEETKLLETEIMPNITFTQPIVYTPISSEIDYVDSQYVDTDVVTHQISENRLVKNIFPGYRLPNIPIVIYVPGLMDAAIGAYGGLIGELIRESKVIKLTVYPSSVKLIGPETYELATPITHTKESPDTYLGRRIFRGNFTEDNSRYFTIPEDLQPGEYNLVYSYSVNSLEYYDLSKWPFGVKWKEVDLLYASDEGFDIMSGLESFTGAINALLYKYLSSDKSSLKGPLKDLINTCSTVIYEKLEYDNSSIQLSQNMENVSETLDVVLEKIEEQIRIPERYPICEYFISSDIKSKLSFEINQEFNTSDATTTKYIDIIDKAVLIPYEEGKAVDLSVSHKILCYNENDTLIKRMNFKTKIYEGTKKKNITINEKLPDTTKYITIERNSTQFECEDFSISAYTKAKPKYIFSETIKSIARGIIAPEYTFEKKTLWEICLEIGEMFNGIPTLNDGVINYFLLNDKEPVSLNVQKEALSKESNMTNYATKLYTPELKNIIQDDAEKNLVYNVYPSPTTWTKVRAVDYFESTVDRQTSAIVIDNENTGIYKIKRVLCRCPIYYKDPDGGFITNYEEFDITEYVLEKSVFDSLDKSLNNSLFGDAYSVSLMGTRAYYERGKNYIRNLAQLPENGSVIGWKQTHLTIQFILAMVNSVSLESSANRHSSKNIFDYEFRVEYYSYHSRLNITRQANLNNIYNQVTSNFNQTSNNISSTQFSKHINEILNKLGNAEITTQYTSNQINDGISIGDCLRIDNKNYYVNDKITTLNNNDKSVVLNLTKDNYKQNNRISVSKEYRQYNIDSNNTLRKTFSKPLSIFISTDEIKLLDKYNANENASNRRTIAKSILQTVKGGNYQIRPLISGFVNTVNLDGTPLEYNTFRTDVSGQTCANKILPLSRETIGNTITFQWDMYDNYSAGRTLKDPSKDTNSWWDNLEVNIGGMTLKEKSFGIKVQTDARYCDDRGQTPLVYTDLFSNNEFAMPNNLVNTFPETTLTRTGINHYIENSLSFVFEANKDSREALSFQATISAQTFDKDIRIENLLKYNPLVINTTKTPPKWYGYEKNNIPVIYQDYGYFSKNELSIKSFETVDNPSKFTTVSFILNNTTDKDFIGYVLCYDDGEVLLDIRKPLKSKDLASVYFNIFDDEISLKDIDYNVRELDRTDLSNYSPGIYIQDNKIYLNMLDFTTSEITRHLSPSDITVGLITKHSTYPRGIQPGYHGRRYAKHKKGDSLFLVGNNWEINGERFGKIYVLDDGQIVFKSKKNGNYINVYEYLMTKKISKQDLSKKESFPYLYYFVNIRYNHQESQMSEIIEVRYDRETREPIEIF